MASRNYKPRGSREQTTKTATEYADFVIHARRRNKRSIEVSVYASPAGTTPKPTTIAFDASEAKRIHESFYSDPTTARSGRMLITQVEATELGKRLSEVLFPTPVFQLLAQSLAEVIRKPQGGLRIRLALDESLIDLPWEYIYRPDHVDSKGVSGFLLLDPKISLVREAANPRIALEPITGQQRLAFVGTLWEGKIDGWQVATEFELLQNALKPVSKYISSDFTVADNANAFGKGVDRAAIFHYAGHCDFDGEDRAYLVREMPTTGTLKEAPKAFIDDLAPALGKSEVRLVVLSACNSGFWKTVKPLLNAEVPAIIGVNGAVASQSTIEFCTKLYESLAVGLTLDEAVGRARLHILEWGRQRYELFDWGLYMIYMPSPQAALFPRVRTRAVATRQSEVRREHSAVISSTLQLARELDGMNFGEIMSELTKRRVLILGRFTGRRLKVLEAIKQHLTKHPNKYIPELFTFRRPESRDLVEAIIAFAALSRFIIADLSEPRSVQSELEAIVPRFLSIPVVPLINRTGREYATFSSLLRRENVVQPTVRYRGLDDLLEKLDDEVVPKAETKLIEVRPPA